MSALAELRKRLRFQLEHSQLAVALHHDELDMLLTGIDVRDEALQKIAQEPDGYVSESPTIRVAYRMARMARDALESDA